MYVGKPRSNWHWAGIWWTCSRSHLDWSPSVSSGKERKWEKFCSELPCAAKKWTSPVPAADERRRREGCRMPGSTCLLLTVSTHRLKSDELHGISGEQMLHFTLKAHLWVLHYPFLLSCYAAVIKAGCAQLHSYSHWIMLMQSFLPFAPSHP